MRKIREIGVTAWVAVCCVALLAGCVKESGPSPEERNVSVLMNVGSRANGEIPTDEEAAIATLRVYAFVKGEPAGHFYTSEPVVSPESFLMDLKMYSETTQMVDFYVVANEGAMVTAGGNAALDEQTTEAELKRFTFTSLHIENGLPMYCHKRVKLNVAENAADGTADMTGHEGHTLLKQEVAFELERSVAKLGVFVAKATGETGELTVTGVALKGSGLRMYNYLASQEEATLRKIEHTGVDYTLQVDATATGKEFPADGDVTDTDNYTNVLATRAYLFENAYGATSWDAPDADGEGNALEISYRIGGVEKTGTVYLPAIERNRYYAVCCRMSNSGVIEVNYTVADWNEAENWEGGLEFEYPTYSNPLEAPDQGVRTKPVVYYSADDAEAGAFVALFQMTAPVGQTWTPVLSESESDFQVKVYKNGVLLPNAKDWVTDPDNWYTIKVVAMSPDNVGKTVNLGIVFDPLYMDDTELLLINGGTGGNTGWPDSGGKTDRIMITQIAKQ